MGFGCVREWIGRECFYFGLKWWNDTCGIPSIVLLPSSDPFRARVCVCMSIENGSHLDFDITTGTQYQIEIKRRLKGCRLCACVCKSVFVCKTWAFLQFIKMQDGFCFWSCNAAWKAGIIRSLGGLITGLWIIIILYAMLTHTHIAVCISHKKIYAQWTHSTHIVVHDYLVVYVLK